MYNNGKADIIEPNTPAQWVVEMHRFFAEHGYYRAEDLNRVLGDPRVGVVIACSGGSGYVPKRLKAAKPLGQLAGPSEQIGPL